MESLPVSESIRAPEVGGDTLFANMSAAYDALSVSMRQMLDGDRPR